MLDLNDVKWPLRYNNEITVFR